MLFFREMRIEQTRGFVRGLAKSARLAGRFFDLRMQLLVLDLE